MGSLLSRLNNQLNNAEEEVDHHPVYKYPPKSGNFFASNFIMGGERFDQATPESYLFGENADLNWLGSKPISFPYLPPKNSEPTKTLKSLVNIRKESVKFVKTDSDKDYNIEFVFDADQKCTIRLYYFATEEITTNHISYVPRETATTSETFYYEKGPSQVFSQPAHIFSPSKYSDEEMQYNNEKDIYPVVIHCVIDDGGDALMHSHSTICVVDHHTTDSEYHLRAMKQKIFVDGLCYLLQEIYGIENKNLTRPITTDDDEDNGSECVICICEPRDTLILPCRHLCLCNSCADSLRYQANNCPICRAPFRALLQIRAVHKSNTPIISINPQDSSENIPMGYMPIPLIEALNGPGFKRNSIDRKDVLQAVELLNKDNDQKSSPANSLKRSAKDKGNGSMVMSVLLSNEENSDLLAKRSPTVARSASKEKKSISRSSSNRDRDCVKYINEKSASNDLDDDSEAEKLSPLLVNDEGSPDLNLRMNSVEDSVDDTDDDKATMMGEEVEAKAEDSDYYTPEDPHTTILSPVKSPSGALEKKDIVTPLDAIKDTELPDSPISGNSQVSTRSSGGESYSSSSSTRQLLSSVPAEADKASESQKN